MKLQSDFVNELTLLQFHAKRIGVTVDRTPKCHPEIAGEGIEYAWALSKLSYRRAPLKKKRNRASFKNLVRESTDPLSVLNIQRIRSCSKKARSYMKLYRVFQSEPKNEIVTQNKHSIMEGSMKLNMKLKKIQDS